jgi:glycosyltransferase involved in cell wall biosynthesis
VDRLNKSVSVVIASGAGGDFLFRCLDSLRNQVENKNVEVIVVDRCGEEVVVRVNREYPFANCIPAELGHHPSVPELRMIGVQKAQGDIVAIIEEHCTAPNHWIETIQSSFREGDAAIGGPILDKDYARIRDWVVYFSEYHNYLPPWTDGNRYALNGANIAYDRRKMLKFKNILASGYWEVVLHPLLAKENAFRSISRMGVFHTGPFDYGYYLGQRYLLSRVWGGTQREIVKPIKRLIYLLIAPILPLLLLGRITSRVIKVERLQKKYLAAFPLMVPVVLAYVLGEWLGYLLGVGDALERVE